MDLRPYFTQLRTPGKVVAGLLAVHGVFAFFDVVSWVAYGGGLDVFDAKTIQVVDTLDNFVRIGASIAFAVWMSDAFRLAHELGVRTKFTAGEAVGSLFIPILNLWRPFDALRDLHAASDASTLPPIVERSPRPSGETGYRDPALALSVRTFVTAAAPLGTWWCLYLARIVLVVMFRTSDAGTKLGLGLMSNGVELVGALVTWSVVARVSARLRIWGERAAAIPAP